MTLNSQERLTLKIDGLKALQQVLDNHDMTIGVYNGQLMAVFDQDQVTLEQENLQDAIDYLSKGVIKQAAITIKFKLDMKTYKLKWCEEKELKALIIDGRKFLIDSFVVEGQERDVSDFLTVSLYDPQPNDAILELLCLENLTEYTYFSRINCIATVKTKDIKIVELDSITQGNEYTMVEK